MSFIKTTQLTKFYQTNPKTSTEGLLKNREELYRIIEEAEEALQDINHKLFDKTASEEEKRLTVGAYTVSIVTRVNFSQVPLEFAKRFRATKKVIDASVLKPLYAKGVQIPNVSTVDYVLVKKEKES